MTMKFTTKLECISKVPQHLFSFLDMILQFCKSCCWLNHGNTNTYCIATYHCILKLPMKIKLPSFIILQLMLLTFWRVAILSFPIEFYNKRIGSKTIRW